MLLAVDIGNTGITLGLFSGENLGPRWRLASDSERTADEYGILLIQLLERTGGKQVHVDHVAIASVVPPVTGIFDRACRDYLGVEPLIVDAGIKTGIRIRYEDPKQVGSDRIVQAAAVISLFKGPACVVDFGTDTAT